jgi:hypothetical protein
MAPKRKPPDLAPDPLVAQLESAGGGEPIVRLAGFLGSDAEGRVRLYLDLSLTEFLEIDRDDILHASAPTEEGKPSILFLPAKARVRRIRAITQDADQVTAGGAPEVLYGPYGPGLRILDLLGGLLDPCAEIRNEVRKVKLHIRRIIREQGDTGLNATIIAIWQDHLAGLEWALQRCEENTGQVSA